MSLHPSLAIAALAAALAAAPAAAQPFPGKPIKMIVSTSPGTAPDIIARLTSDKLDPLLGQRILVENRPTAQGTVAVGELRRAATDGHTIGFLQAAAAVVTPFTYKGASYDIERDVETIATIAYSPMMFVATARANAKTLTDLINAGKVKAEAVTIGNPIRTSIPHLTAELLGQRTGTKFQHVSFSGTGQAIQALMAGDIVYYVDGIAPLVPHVRSGKLVPLAVAADRVLPGLEGIPLAKDTVRDLNVNGWFAVFAPKGTPPAVVARLNADINKVLAMPDVVQRFADLGAYPMPGSPADAAKFVKGEKERFQKVLAEAGVQPE